MHSLSKTRSRIKLLKYAFLSAGICVMIAIIAILYAQNNLQNHTEEAVNETAKPKLSKEYTLSIQHSIFEGISQDSLPYKISAENVVKDADNKYLLNTIIGKYKVAGGAIELTASNGTLDELNKFVILNQNAQITYNGIIFNSAKIKCNLDNKDIESDVPVDVNFKKSNIKADKFNTKNSGNDIIFKGNVESKFDLK